MDRVLHDVTSNDPFLAAQASLDSEYKRLQFIKDHFNYVGPREIVFNSVEVKECKATKAVMHYVSIIDTVKLVSSDPTFITFLEEDNNKNDSVLRDVKDGTCIKTITISNTILKL